MGKTKLTGRGLNIVIVLIFAVTVLLFAGGFAQAAEKAPAKTTTQNPAPTKQEAIKE